jgi:hypothetical protein
MIIIKLIILIVLITYSYQIKDFIKNSIMKNITSLGVKIKYTFKRFYRILNVKKRSEFVWKDLIKYNQKKGWTFGQYETEKRIETSFSVDENNVLNFNYTVKEEKLAFTSIILSEFDEDKSNDLLLLAAHFNSLLSFGVVIVSTKYNYVGFTHSGDLITYMLFDGEIDEDLRRHFNITKDVFWSFKTLLETGDDPVFVFSELLRRNEEKNKDNDN